MDMNSCITGSMSSDKSIISRGHAGEEEDYIHKFGSVDIVICGDRVILKVGMAPACNPPPTIINTKQHYQLQTNIINTKKTSISCFELSSKR